MCFSPRLKSPKYHPPRASKQSDASPRARIFFFGRSKNGLKAGGRASSEGNWNRLPLDVELFSSLCHRRWNFLPNLSIDVADVKGRLAGKQLVNGRAYRIDIIQMSAA